MPDAAATPLAEYYYGSNSSPHEALGRAARELSRGGALYLGGGVGIEKQVTKSGDRFNLTQAAGGKAETFTGPLSAVMRAFTVAGGQTAGDSPGGAQKVTDPAAAARLRELSSRERETQQDIERYERRLTAKTKTSVMPSIPSAADLNDDRWEARRIAELKVELSQIRSERTQLLATGKVEEVEQVRPGTNFTKIPPQNVKKLSGIIAHYKGKAHPFTACVADQVKHGLSDDHAKKRCAVVNDLGHGTTKWRKGGKKKLSEEAERLIEGALARLDVVVEQVGLAATVQLAEGIDDATPATQQLAEGVLNDFGLLSMAGHPLALAVFGLHEGFDEGMHPRDFLGQFKKKVGALKVGETAEAPGGVKVTRRDDGFEVKGGAAMGHHKSGGMMKTGKPAGDEKIGKADSAALLATTRSLRSRDAKSLGGDRHFQSLGDYEAERGAPPYRGPKISSGTGTFRTERGGKKASPAAKATGAAKVGDDLVAHIVDPSSKPNDVHAGDVRLFIHAMEDFDAGRRTSREAERAIRNLQAKRRGFVVMKDDKAVALLDRAVAAARAKLAASSKVNEAADAPSVLGSLLEARR